jgi:predicted  nucleic acid-binding Zn-ribbon protein
MTCQREKSTLHEAHIKQLQQELSMSRVEGSRAELNMVDALTAKNAEIESLVKSLDSWKKRAATSEEKLASLEVSFIYIILSLLFLQEAYYRASGEGEVL